MDPEHRESFSQIDAIPSAPITFMPIFKGEFVRENLQYPIVVEMWDKVVGRSAGGRMKRAWLSQFTEPERKIISRYHTVFYRWHLVTGTPERIAMRLNTWELLKRAVNFFATI